MQVGTQSTDVRKKIRIGDLLVQNAIISQEQLELALKEQKKFGRKLGNTLIDLGYVEEEAFLQFLSKQLGVALIDLKHYEFDPEIVKKIPETIARRYRALVLKAENGRFVVGMADPTDLYAYDEIVKSLGQQAEIALIREADLLVTFDMVYRRTSEISSLAKELGRELSDGDFDLTQLLESSSDDDAPVAKLLKSIFEDAVQMNASDIHIEPDERVLRIRQRVDGVLYEQVMDQIRISSAVVLRLKIMGGLDISEKRIPQDGRFHIRVKQRNIDVRLSTMPVQYGESVVMRLLDQSNDLLGLESLGMESDLVAHFRTVMHRPHGLILVTGPTGSGKTTTLYAALQELNQPGKKIITAEDPVEYRMSRINQVQVKHKIGLGFVEILRAALRQDPDIILIGEMRDQETVDIGLRAAMTGHLVMSTLHTNDAVSTIDRLLDMGAPGFLVASSLQAIVAQRLVRRVCQSCGEKRAFNPREKVWLDATMKGKVNFDTVKQGKGCAHCNHTGYKGRVGVYEFLEPDTAMLNALRADDSVAFSQAAKHHKTFVPMHQRALKLIESGLTTVEELMRISVERIEDEL
ncbi:MAG: Flp pilus assembly complex ATPase component TadA [Gammaproteobacteria bacterium]|nr:Flp pilus assembly complex ATPase component TadA [Gammaproteobacteria bacterium]